MPHKHVACVKIMNQLTTTTLKVKVFPDNGKNGLEFLMDIVVTRFDSTLNIENVPGEDLFKVWNESIMLNSNYRQMWGELMAGITTVHKKKLASSEKFVTSSMTGYAHLTGTYMQEM